MLIRHLSLYGYEAASRRNQTEGLPDYGKSSARYAGTIRRDARHEPTQHPPTQAYSLPYDPDVYTFLAVCAVVVGSVGALVAIGVSARVRLLRAERGSNAPRIDENRLQHLEQAVDAIAIEIERISESQRFTTKLLAERQRESLH